MGQRDYGLVRNPIPGALADTTFKDVVTLINNDPAAKQVDTLTVGNYAPGKVYRYTIDGVAKSYTAVTADANNNGVAAKIAAQINRDPLCSGLILAAAALAVVTATGRIISRGWTLQGGTDLVVAHVTANGVADPIPYGTLVLEHEQSDVDQTKYGRIAKSANLVARRVVLTPVLVAGANYTVGVVFDGIAYVASYSPTEYEDVADLCAELANILTAQLPAESVEASEDDGDLILESALAGLYFGYSVGSSDDSAIWTIVDNDDLFCDVNLAARGIAVKDDSRTIGAEALPGYEANSALGVLRHGRIVVRTENEITTKHPVYVRVADSLVTGNVIGSFRSTPATDCIKLDRLRFRWSARIAPGLAELQVNC